MEVDQDFLGKGIQFPPGIKEVSKEGELYPEISTSSGEDLIKESIIIILGTAKGERVMRPGFGCGIHELVFAPNNTSTATLVAFYVKEALLKWEPRIEVLNVQATPDKEGNKLDVYIEYRVKTSNAKGNFVYPFYLEAGK